MQVEIPPPCGACPHTTFRD